MHSLLLVHNVSFVEISVRFRVNCYKNHFEFEPQLLHNYGQKPLENSYKTGHKIHQNLHCGVVTALDCQSEGLACSSVD